MLSMVSSFLGEPIHYWITPRSSYFLGEKKYTDILNSYIFTYILNKIEDKEERNGGKIHALERRERAEGKAKEKEEHREGENKEIRIIALSYKTCMMYRVAFQGLHK